MSGNGIQPIGHQYRFVLPLGGEMWRDSPRERNGQRPRGSRPIFIEPPESLLVVRLLADKMAQDELLRLRFNESEHWLIARAVGKLGRPE